MHSLVVYNHVFIAEADCKIGSNRFAKICTKREIHACTLARCNQYINSPTATKILTFKRMYLSKDKTVHYICIRSETIINNKQINHKKYKK